MELQLVLSEQRAYFEDGATRSLDFRKRELLKFRKALQRWESRLTSALFEDLGKSAYESYATEIGLVYSEISYMLKHLSAMARPRRVPTPATNFPARSRIYLEPYGVVLIMSPWNYPVQLTLVPLIGAIAAGNCVLVKPSNYAPRTAEAIEQMLGETFECRYIYTVTGGRDTNQTLLAEKFDYIFFTGGKAVGRTVMEAASRHLTPITLELGGKSPCIVDRTADIPMAARRIVWGKFLNCGQTCVAPDYVLADAAVKEKLLEAMVRNIEALYGKDPLNSKDYGKIVNQKHYKRLTGMLQHEKPYYFGGVDQSRCKIGPILLDRADWNSASMAEEIFGPILPVLEFDDLRQVKKQIQARPRPLALYLFTSSKGTEREILRDLSFGGGCVNDTVMHLTNPHLPFGGTGESGMGAYHGKYSFQTFSHRKSVLKKSTRIDLPFRYAPYPESRKLLRLFLK